MGVHLVRTKLFLHQIHTSQLGGRGRETKWIFNQWMTLSDVFIVTGWEEGWGGKGRDF